MSRAPGISDLTEFVTPADVQRVLQCSRSTAYEHLRRASGRPPEQRGLLRVPVRTWERYIREHFEWQTSTRATGANTGAQSSTIGMAGVTSAQPSARTKGPLKLLLTASSAKPKIPITQPR